jgi:hypothetical protein
MESSPFCSKITKYASLFNMCYSKWHLLMATVIFFISFWWYFITYALEGRQILAICSGYHMLHLRANFSAGFIVFLCFASSLGMQVNPARSGWLGCMIRNYRWLSLPALYLRGPGFNLGPEADYPGWSLSWFSSEPSGKCWDGTLN